MSGITIKDGLTANTARVDRNNRLEVNAVMKREIEQISEDEGQAYSWASGTYNPDALDTILLLKNTSVIHLHISAIWISSDTDTRVIVHLPVAEVTPTGTAIVGTNLNTGSQNVAEATAIRDETNNTQGPIIFSGEIHAAANPFVTSPDGSLIIAKNSSIAVDFVSAVTACDVTIIGYYEA